METKKCCEQTPPCIPDRKKIDAQLAILGMEISKFQRACSFVDRIEDCMRRGVFCDIFICSDSPASRQPDE